MLQISDRICSIQPLTWLLTSKKQNKDITNIIDEYGASIEQLNANQWFDAGFAGNVSINYINKLSKGKIIFNDIEYNKCDEITLTTIDRKLNVFLDKLSNFNNNKVLNDYLIFMKDIKNNQLFNENKYFISISRIRGNVTSNNNSKLDDYYTLIPKIEKNINCGKLTIENTEGLNNDFRTFIFDSEYVLNNFINYIKTDFVRTILLIFKINTNININLFKHIPWFDFSDNIFSKSPKEIDDYLFEKYNISNEIRKHIEEILPDYYNIRKGHS